jgi:hypothetical protein
VPRAVGGGCDPFYIITAMVSRVGSGQDEIYDSRSIQRPYHIKSTTQKARTACA